MQRPRPDARLVLIAERDQQVRRLQEHFLTVAGYSVTFADDGQSALDRARAEPPALVVTEILIPKLDGLALCRSLREDPATRAVPLLVLSILAAQVRAAEAGADAFLRKPIVDSTFLAAVQELVAAPTTRATEQQWATR
jgi:CheY-like chemotaxis protein